MVRKRSLSHVFAATMARGLVFQRITKRSALAEGPAREDKATVEPAAAGSFPSKANVGARPKARGSGFSAGFHLIGKAFGRFMDDDCTSMAAALAYYATFSLAPLLLIVISIVGLIFGRQAVQHQIQSQIQGLIGPGPASQVGAMVQNAGRHASAGILGAVLGIIALLFGATGVLVQLQSSLDRIWRVKPDPKAGDIKNFIGQRILSLGMIIAIAFLLVISLAVSAALSAFGGFVSDYLPHGFSGPLLQAIGFLVSLVIIALMFASMFNYLPDARVLWPDVWTGAVITAILFTIGKFLIGLYLGNSGLASAYGAAGSLVLIVLWIYYSSMIFLFGAEFTAIRSEAHLGSVQPKPRAVRAKVEENDEPERN
jgi:membrane protein